MRKRMWAVYVLAIAGILSANILPAQTAGSNAVAEAATVSDAGEAFAEESSQADSVEYAPMIDSVALGAVVAAALAYLIAVLMCDKLREAVFTSVVLLAVGTRLSVSMFLPQLAGKGVLIIVLLALFGISVISLWVSLQDRKEKLPDAPFKTAASLFLVAGVLLDLIPAIFPVNLSNTLAGVGYLGFAILEPFALVRNLAARLEILTDDHEKLYVKLAEADKKIAAAKKEINQIDYYDRLTGLFNRNEIYRKMKFEKERLKRYHRTEEVSFSVVFIELESVEYYVKQFGQAAKDLLLMGFADSIRKISRASDVPCRFEGGEFVVMLIETDTGGAKIFAERLMEEVESREWFAGDIANHLGKRVEVPLQNRIACAAGISNYVIDSTSGTSDLDIDAAIEKAERAMRSAKSEGKNAIEIWEGI